MSARHASMDRLQKFAASQGIDNTELAAMLNQSAQTMTNWAARGVSKAGALESQAVLGVSAMWVLSGEGPMNASGSLPEREDHDIAGCAPTDIGTTRDSEKVMLRLPNWMREAIRQAAENNNRTATAEYVNRLHSSFESTTLRDEFAKAAMQGICTHPDTWGESVDGIPVYAYRVADAMLKARGGAS